MSVLGVVTCEILEGEVADLLAADRDVARISVVADARAAALAAALEARGVRHLARIPHVRAFRPDPAAPLEVVVRVLAVALHRTRAGLRRAVTDAVEELASRVDALCLGYGRCGGALDGVAELLAGERPLAVPEDADGPVDDCVALLLGGGAAYRRVQREVPGTFFMTPGWARHWRGALDGGRRPESAPRLRRVFAGYERALLVLPPGAPEQAMRRDVEEFRAVAGVRVEACRGTTALLAAAWRRAKDALRGGEARWS